MADPSDRYSWRDFLLDLEHHGCTLEVHNGIPTIARRTADGRHLRVPITPAGGVESAIYPTTVKYIVDKLELELELFLA